MAFFRSVTSSDALPVIEGEGVVLRWPSVSDFAEWSALREESRAFLTPWEPTWPPDDLTRSAYRRRLRRYEEDQRNDLSYSFFIFSKVDEALVGGLTIAMSGAASPRLAASATGSARLLPGAAT